MDIKLTRNEENLVVAANLKVPHFAQSLIGKASPKKSWSTKNNEIHYKGLDNLWKFSSDIFAQDYFVQLGQPYQQRNVGMLNLTVCNWFFPSALPSSPLETYMSFVYMK